MRIAKDNHIKQPRLAPVPYRPNKFSMMKTRILKILRQTPFHPQWLLRKNEDLGRWIVTLAHGTVLDVGCANRWVERILPTGTRYIGIDYLVTGKYLYKAAPDAYADAAHLPFAADSCDCVLLLEVLEHLSAPQSALREAARVLRPGGKLLLTIPFLYPIHDAPHDYQRLTSHGLHRDIIEAGLEAKSIQTRLNTIETAALLACLALGGSALQAVRQRAFGVILLPLLGLMIPAINLGGWLLGSIFPNWTAFTSGYQVLATKPTTVVDPGAITSKDLR